MRVIINYAFSPLSAAQYCEMKVGASVQSLQQSRGGEVSLKYIHFAFWSLHPFVLSDACAAHVRPINPFQFVVFRHRLRGGAAIDDL